MYSSSTIFLYLANTYRLASHLPSLILDGLLNIPHILIAIRNRILPVEPFLRPAQDFPLPTPITPGRAAVGDTSDAYRQDERRDECSESSSEADVESNASESVDSWISLHKTQESEDHPGEEL